MASVLTFPSVQNYVASLKTKTTTDAMSLCSLLTRKVSQSTNIRLGNELEKILNLYASEACVDATDIRPTKVKKGERQKDFLREFPDSVVYAEFKSNINLDTEKRKATREKVNTVAVELASAHPKKVVKSYLVTLRYLRTEDIPPFVAGSYADVTLIGVGDFFHHVLSCSPPDFESYPAYTEFLMAIVDELESTA
jgi:hypothetical protein